MTRRISSLVLASVVAAATMNAQERPNFSGTWSADHSVQSGTGNANRANGLNLDVPPSRLVISQDEKTLSVEGHYTHKRGGGPLMEPRNTVLYPLDGRTVTNQVAIPFGKSDALFLTAPAEFTCQWKGNQLVATITLNRPDDDGPRRFEQKMSLKPDGALVVELAATGTPHSITSVYRKPRR